MKQVLSKCPVCGGRLHVSELSCAGCETRIHSTFEGCRFCGMPSEHSRFLQLFLQRRGNLTSVGDEMGISYPTVAKRLDALLCALGLAEGQSQSASEPANTAVTLDSSRARILEMLDSGEITAEEATRRLQEL